LVLLGAAARSQSIRGALVDAIESMDIGHSARPGDGDALAFELGPLPEPPSAAGLRALAQLDAGEQWLVKPKRLDKQGLLWRPGIRTGLSRDSRFWNDAVGVPVIGLLAAHTIDDAISLTNRLGGGGVAALEANDPGETLPWLEHVRAAAISLGRPTTHTRVERQPVGGWGEAAMGAELLAGGPSRLLTLGSWSAYEGTASSTLHLRGLRPEVRVLIEVAQASLDYPSFDRVRRAALSDTLAWRTGLGKAEDVSGLGVERNLLRHRPVSTHLRLAESAPIAELIRVVCAGLVAGAPMTVSTGVVLPPEVSEFLAMQGITVSLERDDAWLERVSVSGPGDAESPAARVRLIGGDRVRTAEWLGGLGDVALFAQPVTMAGPVELLAFVREQSVSICAHRHDLAMLPAGVGGYIAELQGQASR
jgi:RHH-type proline utilization regulon transcriptional repressor/proline dehydrogenase/delta 1-pyrroline-5-carboxylate dehydrogenase